MFREQAKTICNRVIKGRFVEKDGEYYCIKKEGGEEVRYKIERIPMEYFSDYKRLFDVKIYGMDYEKGILTVAYPVAKPEKVEAFKIPPSWIPFYYSLGEHLGDYVKARSLLVWFLSETRKRGIELDPDKIDVEKIDPQNPKARLMEILEKHGKPAPSPQEVLAEELGGAIDELLEKLDEAELKAYETLGRTIDAIKKARKALYRLGEKYRELR